ncbi:AMP-dependent synthetase/ligase [Tessaracoccus lacteus]|uniref:Long-chain fatty acid--CoA ligase n=1 Tax=Tessaracoccus lacteus TaxID=3041766 RepID=A0ABY8PV79_9ACTN|nr:long-chain fatty acid--CoA ligase [Tessaracoccus sp. T21]WGT46368.1 long-chain fatty acid--CoA ligase [Tessaracoccus sp. T21]
MSIREELLEKAADNVGHMFRRRVEATPDHEAFLDPDRAAEGPNTWQPYTWRQSQVVVDRLAAGLLSRGLKYEERVAIASSTRLEWIFVDLAIACAAGATTTIYPNTAREEFDYILTDSGSVVLFAEDRGQLEKALGHDVLDSQLHTIVLIDADGVELNDRVISYQQLLDAGEAHLAAHPTAVDDAIASTTRDTLSTLIYTSGTTGTPKGVRLNHISWVYEGIATKHLDVIEHTDLQYLWLPLSHVFGKALIACQLEYGFTSAVDGRIDRIVDGLGEVRPTFMCGAPRIFEKVRGAVMTGSKGVKARIARWAFAVGRDAVPYLSKGQELPSRLAIQHRLADRLVYSKLKEKLGGRIKFMISGSAKLSPQIQAWFFGAGIVIVEGYGSTETSAIACFDLPNPTLGTVGPPLPGIEFKIADDGEVLINGPIITPGYHNLPERTAEVLHDGWYATGDIGHLTDEGKLVITERKKDLFKTSGGKYVAPQKVEAAITANIPYISQAIAVGDGRKYCSALVVLDPQLLAKWAQKRGLEGLSYADLTQRSEIHASVEKQMEKANAKLERWETVKKFTILDHELTVENEGVTANMKIRRSIVTGKYQDLVDAMYPQED